MCFGRSALRHVLGAVPKLHISIRRDRRHAVIPRHPRLLHHVKACRLDFRPIGPFPGVFGDVEQIVVSIDLQELPVPLAC